MKLTTVFYGLRHGRLGTHEEFVKDSDVLAVRKFQILSILAPDEYVEFTVSDEVSASPPPDSAFAFDSSGWY